MSARLRVLGRPAFRNLWLAQGASAVGDRLVIVALALFVTDLTGSATDVGSGGVLPALVVGGILTAVVLALGLIPRETRTLRSEVPLRHEVGRERPPAGP